MNFRIHYLVMGVVGALGMGLLRRPLGVAAGVVAIALNLLPVLHYFDAGDPIPAAQASGLPTTTLRVASANVFEGNGDVAAVAEWIASRDADVVILVEASARWRERLAMHGIRYPHHHLEVRAGRIGKLVLSKWPIEQVRRLSARGTRTATPMLRILKDGRPVWVAAVHTMWPMIPSGAALRNEELSALGEAAANIDEPWVAAGDFNVTPFSPHFQRMMTLGNLHRAAAGRGWMPTWPVFLPLAGIQIDHAVVSEEVTVRALATGDGIGSDHRWLVVDLTY